MKTLFTFLPIFCALFVNAQSAIEWQNTIGSDSSDHLWSMQQTADGGYILGGSSISGIEGDKTDSCRGSFDFWIIKTDSAGNVIWDKTIGGSGYDWLTCIQQTMDGGYIAGGFSDSDSSGDKTEPSDTMDYWVLKLDNAGNILWQNTIGGNGREELWSLQQTTDGGYILGGSSQSGISGDKNESSQGNSDYWVLKLDTTGNILWQNTIGGNSWDDLYALQQTGDGGYIIGGRSSSTISGDRTMPSFGSLDCWVLKLDSAGNIIWQKAYGGDGNDELVSLQETTDGGYILGSTSTSNLSGNKTEPTLGESDYWVIKLDAAGNITWQNTIGASYFEFMHSVRQTSDGGYILGGVSRSGISGDKIEPNLGSVNSPDYWVIKLDGTGSIVWQNTIGGNSSDELLIAFQTNDGEFILGGYSDSGISGDKTESYHDSYILSRQDFWIIKLWTPTNLITGNVFIDANANCLPDASEPRLQNLLLKVEPWNIYTTTDSSGDYSFWVDEGSYTVSLLTAKEYLSPECPAGGFYNTNFAGENDTSSGNNFGFSITTVCPFMEVDISGPPQLRRCSPLHGDYVIHYCNNGTGFAINAYVSVKIPTNSLTVVGSSIPWRTPQSGSVFLFDIGDVAPGQCGSFSIDVSVTCNPQLGQTICVLAHIYPDTLCAPIDTVWDGSTVSVDGECANDTVKFQIENTGSNMQDSLFYRIIEDNVMLRTGKFKLLNGQKIPLFQPANGATFRLEADQSAGHPGESHPAFMIEGCSTNSTGGISLGFVNTLPQDEDDPFVSVTCDEIIGSYDPNDKTSFPKGIGDDKLISSTTELDYKIRFQNTGNDTAFKVVIRDTLSPYLDIASLELGAASHPYDFRIYGPRILEWTFDNILLPDSFVNEPESHGFVQFRVSQTPNNPEGTVIENSADIYFDFNLPVKTKVEFNTVGDINKTLTSVFANFDLQNNIRIYPNPFSDFLTVEIEGNRLRQVQFEVYDMLGRLNRKYVFENMNQFTISNLNLNKGMYFYRVVSDGKTLGAGKIIGF